MLIQSLRQRIAELEAEANAARFDVPKGYVLVKEDRHL